jgi:ATP-binding cassette subfamily B protein
MKTTKKITIRAHFAAYMRAVKIISKMIPWYQTTLFVHEILGAVQPLLILFFSAQLIDELSSAQKNIERIVLFAALAVGVTFVIAIARALLNHKLYPIRFTFEGAALHSWLLRGEHFAKMDYEYAEDPAIKLKMQEIYGFENFNGYGLVRVFTDTIPAIGQFVSLIGSVVLIGGLLGSLLQSASGIALLILPFAVILLNIPFIKRNAKISAEISETMPKINACGNYYLIDYVTASGAAMDIRIFNQKKLIAEVNKLSRFPGVIKLFAKTTCLSSGINAFVNATIGGAAYIVVGLKALNGALGIGQVTQYVGAITTFTSSLSAFVKSVQLLAENTKYLHLLYDFLDLPSVKYQGTLTTEKRSDNEYELEFRNVSFKYPGTDIWALRNLNLKLHIGRKLAVVGMNGSGKSTMIKLLCRLYDPTEGEITLNGIDVRKYDLREYMDLFAVAFQDFKLTAFPLGQNVATSVDYDAERVRETLLQVGFNNDMPLETPLYQNFDEEGIQISGGEAQKIALARALYRAAPVIILDEPTAALDPIAEAEIYGKFDGIVGERTAIYISHRLSSCRFCDDIAVFDHGELIQRGSHDDLLSDSAGKYHALWNAQAQWYE